MHQQLLVLFFGTVFGVSLPAATLTQRIENLEREVSTIRETVPLKIQQESIDIKLQLANTNNKSDAVAAKLDNGLLKTELAITKTDASIAKLHANYVLFVYASLALSAIAVVFSVWLLLLHKKSNQSTPSTRETAARSKSLTTLTSSIAPNEQNDDTKSPFQVSRFVDRNALKTARETINATLQLATPDSAKALFDAEAALSDAELQAIHSQSSKLLAKSMRDLIWQDWQDLAFAAIVLRKLPNAIYYFDRVIESFCPSVIAANSLLNKGVTYTALARTDEATEAYKKLQSRFSGDANQSTALLHILEKCNDNLLRLNAE